MGLRKWHGDVATLLVSPKVSMGETMLAPIFLYFVMGGFLFRSHLGRALFLRFRHECSYLFRRRIIGKHVTANLKLTSRGVAFARSDLGYSSFVDSRSLLFSSPHRPVIVRTEPGGQYENMRATEFSTVWQPQKLLRSGPSPHRFASGLQVGWELLYRRAETTPSCTGTLLIRATRWSIQGPNATLL